MRQPEIGDMVRFVAPDGCVRPAVVVVVGSADIVSLSVFTDPDRDHRWTFAHPRWQPNVQHSAAKLMGTWHWASALDYATRD